MHRAMEDRSLLGIKVSNQASSVNHLLFDDDSLANVKVANKLKISFRISNQF